MLDYKDIIIKHYALGMSGREIARTLSVSKTGVNSFLNAFKECKTLSYPLPEGITNYGIASAVYGSHTTVSGRDLTYELPDYGARRQVVQKTNVGDPVNLLRDPGNPYDQDAIVVKTLDGEEIGFLSADWACIYAQKLDIEMEYSCSVISKEDNTYTAP